MCVWQKKEERKGKRETYKDMEKIQFQLIFYIWLQTSDTFDDVEDFWFVWTENEKRITKKKKTNCYGWLGRENVHCC